VQIRDRVKELRRVKASELRPSPRNWRTHPKAQRDALRGALAEIGYAGALLARELPDATLELIDGHLRAETTPDSLVPVLILDVDEAEAAKLLATLDPLAAMAAADADKLEALLREVGTESEPLAAMLAGLAEANGILGTNGQALEDAEPQLDRAEELRREWGVKPGQLWHLGDHRLLCGDSTKAEDVARVMGGEKSGLCFTSPPYAVQRDYDAGQGAGDWDSLLRGTFGNLPMSDDGQVLVNLGLVHRDGEWLPYWDGWIAWMREQGWRRFGWYVWDKLSGMPGDWNGRLAPSFEFVWHFNRIPVRPEKAFECENAGRVVAGRTRGADGRYRIHTATKRGDAVQSHKIGDSVIRCGTTKGQPTSHPATMPVELPSYIIRSWPGVVYDPFLGSGTTLIACEQLGRRCRALEISPGYVAVTLQRFLDATGERPARG
jgi:DNA modification methylase